MIKATQRDKPLVEDILARAFDDNKSVNYVIPQDARRKKRIRALMNYSFEVCSAFGEVFLADNRKACALVLYPDKKKTTLRSLALDAKLILSCTGIGNARKVLRRESLIKKTQLEQRVQQPGGRMYYLWFIGVDPDCQQQGTGSRLFEELTGHARELQRPVFLETSTLKNLPWYKRFGLNVYAGLDLGYRLYFLTSDRSEDKQGQDAAKLGNR